MKTLIFKPGAEPAVLRFALSSHSRIWKICWELNNALSLNIKLVAPPILSEPELKISSPDSMDAPSREMEASPDELIYTDSVGWLEYRLMTVQVAQVSQLRGFHFIFEIESEKSDGLPDPAEIMTRLKNSSVISAVIKL